MSISTALEQEWGLERQKKASSDDDDRIKKVAGVAHG